MPCFFAASHIARVVGPSGTASADSNHLSSMVAGK